MQPVAGPGTQSKASLTLSNFVESVFRLPIRGELQPFSFEGRRYLRRVYDTPAQKTVLMCGRQVEKSTSQGNKMLSAASLHRFVKILYVAPRQGQAQTFSRDRLKQPLLWSEVLGNLQLNKGAKDNAMYKEFVSGSEIRLGYAYLTADAIRGIMADLLFVDELQNVLATLLPVIEECTFSSEYKQFHYAGTPLTESNTLSRTYNKFSTQNEWMIPCDGCGGGDYRYWNLPGEENIGADCLVCARCGKEIFPMHKSSQWVSMNPDPGVEIPFEGFRIPQIISPRVSWPELLDKRKRYPRAQFLNEVLGIPHDVGATPITKEELRQACDPRVSMYSDQYPYGPSFWAQSREPKWFGIDWGSAENSYTVLSTGAYLTGKFTFINYKKFMGELSEPDRQIAEIDSIYGNTRNVDVVGTDYGGGFVQNAALTTRYGPRKIAKYQYVNSKTVVKWEPALSRFMVNRTEIMSRFFNAVKNGHIRFPRWEEFEPFAEDFLSIYSEYREDRHTMVYDKLVDGTDDAFHSSVYCLLASMLSHPRPDLMSAGAAFMQRD